MTPSARDWEALERALDGDLVLPGSSEYESARKPAIVRFHHVRSEAVACCRSAADVAEVITFARRVGLGVAARSGGHCFAGRSTTQGIVIDVAPMHAVSVSDGEATVGAGARLGQVYESLAQHGLTIAAGCGPEVGIAGLTLGGGLGLLGRRHGLTSDQLLGARVVLADGRTVECDAHEHAELFWALRGAGAESLGVVTELVVRTLPEPAATSFQLVWPRVHAVAVAGAWQAWAPGAPDDLAASLLVTVAGDEGEAPLVNVFGALLGGEADARALLAELVERVAADPDSSVFRHGSYSEAKRHLADLGDRIRESPRGAPLEPGLPFSKSEFFRQPLPPEAVGTLMERLEAGRPAGQSRELDFTPWAGAYNRIPADATAFVHRQERFLLKQAVEVAPGASAAELDAARRWLAESWATVHPWGSGGVYPNFPDPELADPELAYHGANLDRLLRVRALYDPDGFFSPDSTGSPAPTQSAMPSR